MELGLPGPVVSSWLQVPGRETFFDSWLSHKIMSGCCDISCLVYHLEGAFLSTPPPTHSPETCAATLRFDLPFCIMCLFFLLFLGVLSSLLRFLECSIVLPLFLSLKENIFLFWLLPSLSHRGYFCFTILPRICFDSIFSQQPFNFLFPSPVTEAVQKDRENYGDMQRASSLPRVYLVSLFR